MRISSSTLLKSIWTSLCCGIYALYTIYLHTHTLQKRFFENTIYTRRVSIDGFYIRNVYYGQCFCWNICIFWEFNIYFVEEQYTRCPISIVKISYCRMYIKKKKTNIRRSVENTSADATAQRKRHRRLRRGNNTTCADELAMLYSYMGGSEINEPAYGLRSSLFGTYIPVWWWWWCALWVYLLKLELEWKEMRLCGWAEHAHAARQSQ